MDNYSYENSQNVRLCRIWLLMHQRCYLQSHSSYPKYGGGAITVCDEWRDNIEPFRLWSLENGYQNHLSLDRIDNSKGYRPDNCRWSTRSEQSRNRRNNVFITAFKETKCARDWVNDSRYAISQQQLIKRIRSGMKPEEALTKPSQLALFRSKTERECSACGEIKARVEFPLDKRFREGNKSICYVCQRDISRDLARRIRGHTREYNRPYRSATEFECGRCRQIKPIGVFRLINRNGTEPGGWCKTCRNEYAREGYAKHKNKK